MRKPYLPHGDSDRLKWLTNFSGKIGGYSASLGLTPAEVTAIAAYLVLLKYTLDLMDAVSKFSQDLTKFKDKLIIASIGSPLGPVPALVIPAAPPVTPAGIFTLISGFVKRIKGSANYTEAIGEDLGIIGADIIEDNASKKPSISITIDVDRPKIKYKKQRTSGLNLYADHNDGTGMVFMKFISKTTFLDLTNMAPGKTTDLWKYMGIYVVDDIEVGIPSDPVSVTVKKKV